MYCMGKEARIYQQQFLFIFFERKLQRVNKCADDRLSQKHFPRSVVPSEILLLCTHCLVNFATSQHIRRNQTASSSCLFPWSSIQLFTGDLLLKEDKLYPIPTIFSFYQEKSICMILKCISLVYIQIKLAIRFISVFTPNSQSIYRLKTVPIQSIKIA